MSEIKSNVASVQPAEEPSALPSYVTDPNAILEEAGIHWRYGRAPDYSSTRKVFAATKTMSHKAGSLPQLVENLVKNWEVEASFKPRLEEWRTVDPDKYSFAINGSDPQSAQHMLKHGTYNAIIAPNEYYSPEFSDFASSHKTFKRMMPAFAWEVLEVYSGPPTVVFRWRHWGVMSNSYVGLNNKGEKITVRAHGGPIDIQGVTVASVNGRMQLQDVRTWFDPMDMFRQIDPKGVLSREMVNKGVSPGEAVDSEGRMGMRANAIREAHQHGDRTNGAQEEGELMKMVGCPFAASMSKEAKAPFAPWQTKKVDVGSMNEQTDKEEAKLAHSHLEWSEGTKEKLMAARQEGAEEDPNV